MSQSRPCVHVIRFAILQVDAAADVHALIEHACLASPLAVPIMPAAPPAALGVGGGLEAGDGGEEGGGDAAQGGEAGEEVQPPPPADEEADGAGERVGGGWEGEAVGDTVGGKVVEAGMAEGSEVLIREKLLAATRALVCQVRDLERYCCMNTLALVKSTRRHDEGAEQAALPVVLSALKSQGFFASAYMAALLPDCARLKTLQDKILAALAPEAAGDALVPDPLESHAPGGVGEGRLQPGVGAGGGVGVGEGGGGAAGDAVQALASLGFGPVYGIAASAAEEEEEGSGTLTARVSAGEACGGAGGVAKMDAAAARQIAALRLASYPSGVSGGVPASFVGAGGGLSTYGVASTYFTPPVPLPPGGGAQSVRPGVAAAAVGMQLPVPGSYHVGYNPGFGAGGMVRAGGGVQNNLVHMRDANARAFLNAQLEAAASGAGQRRVVAGKRKLGVGVEAAEKRRAVARVEEEDGDEGGECGEVWEENGDMWVEVKPRYRRRAMGIGGKQALGGRPVQEADVSTVPFKFSLTVIRQHFNMSLNDAAKALGICATAIKKV